MATPPEVVRAAFQYSLAADVPLCAFLGDECATLRQGPELQVEASCVSLVALATACSWGTRPGVRSPLLLQFMQPSSAFPREPAQCIKFQEPACPQAILMKLTPLQLCAA